MALLRRPPPGHTPWWSPPEAPDRRGSTALGTLCYLALVFGFIGTLLTQTITFAADEFDASKTDQSAVLSLVRIGVLGALVVTSLADRRGRRRVLLGVRDGGLRDRRAVRAGARPRVARRRPDARARVPPPRAGCWSASSRRRRCPPGSRAFAFSLRRRGGRARCRALPDGAPARRPRRGRVAPGDGGVGPPAPAGAAGGPAPPREPPLRRRPRRGRDGRARLALLAARGVGPPAGAVHRAGLPAAQRVPPRRGGLRGAGRSPSSPSSPTRPGGSGS